MSKVKQGDYVKVHYTGKYDDGEVFDSSRGCQPLEVHIGSNEVIPGFENALLGMSPQEKKTFTLSPAEAYGDRDENLEKTFPRSDFPDDFQAEEGQVIVLQSPEHGEFPAIVKGMDGDNVILDLNHPLAGKNISFDVEIMEINDHPTEAPSSCGCGCTSCS